MKVGSCSVEGMWFSTLRPLNVRAGLIRMCIGCPVMDKFT